MYFDIVMKQVPDKDGNIRTQLIPVSVPPEYPDITPSDMSTSNQLKAGAQLERVQSKAPDKLLQSDRAQSDLFTNVDNLSRQVSDFESQLSEQQPVGSSISRHTDIRSHRRAHPA